MTGAYKTFEKKTGNLWSIRRAARVFYRFKHFLVINESTAGRLSESFDESSTVPFDNIMYRANCFTKFGQTIPGVGTDLGQRLLTDGVILVSQIPRDPGDLGFSPGKISKEKSPISNRDLLIFGSETFSDGTFFRGMGNPTEKPALPYKYRL